MDVDHPGLDRVVSRAEALAPGDEIVGGIPDGAHGRVIDGRQNRRRIGTGVTEAAAHVFHAQREPEVFGATGRIKQDRPDRVESLGGQAAAVGQAGAGVVSAHVAAAREQPHARAADGRGEVHGGSQQVQVLAPAR